MMTRGFLPLLAIVAATGIAALAWETDGFRVVTSAGARQLSIERTPRLLPDVRLVDQDGHAFSLSSYEGRPVLVDFIYTRCPTLCGVLGDDFHGVLQLMSGAGAGAPIDLLSISFDPQNDDREALQLYGDRYGAKAPRWRIATPADERGLAELMQSFGVVVIPDGMGGFIHNSAVYLVDARGRLARILDPDSPPQLFADALRGVVAMSARVRFVAAIGSWLTLWLWPVRIALESDMAVHMTVQVPLLIGIGLFLATAVRPHEPHWLADADWLGIPGIVMVVLGTSFWMLPRALDGAVADPLDGRSQVPEPAAAGGVTAGPVLAPHAAARPRVHLGQFHSQAWRDRRPLSGGADAALRLLSARPAGRGRLDADRPRRRAGHAMVHRRVRRLAGALGCDSSRWLHPLSGPHKKYFEQV